MFNHHIRIKLCFEKLYTLPKWTRKVYMIGIKRCQHSLVKNRFEMALVFK